MPCRGMTGKALLLLAALAACVMPALAVEETFEAVVRFECKMIIEWVPSVGRFLFYDGEAGQKYFSSCVFEDMMWHHTMVTITEDGVGALFVDGEQQQLVIANNLLNLAEGFTDPIGDTFATEVYPNKLVSVAAKRRNLLQTDAPTNSASPTTDAPTAPPTTASPTVFTPTMDGLLDGLRGDDGYPVSQMDNPDFTPSRKTCDFRMGVRCEGKNKGFEGLIDEVAVWNRALPAALVPAVMFGMPGYLPEKHLEATGGEQKDYTLGRVLYARFQNPCMEAPKQAPPVPPPPAPECQNEGCVFRRRLHQIAGSNGYRISYVTDRAGYSAGTSEGGRINTQDLDNDRILFLDFANREVGYVYTGVPWAPPTVGAVQFTHPLVTVEDATVPLDGGVQITLQGVGFARSPWLKCAMAEPDPRSLSGRPESPMDAFKADGSGYSTSWDSIPGSMWMTLDTKYAVGYTSQAMYSDATVQFGNWSAAPRISPYFDGSAWDTSICDGELPYWCNFQEVREEAIHPFFRDGRDPYSEDWQYGYWEQIVCDAPAAAFPSDRFHFGASNDGGVRTSAPFEGTYQEYAVRFHPGEQADTFEADEELPRAMGQQYSVAAWFMPAYADAASAPGMVQTIFYLNHDSLVGPHSMVGLNQTTLHLEINADYKASAAVQVAPMMWHHAMLVVYESDAGLGLSAKLFLDGEKVYDTIGFQRSTVTQLTAGNEFDGYIDELKVFSGPIADDKVVSIMRQREMADNPNGLLAYYRFNNGFDSLVGGFSGFTERNPTRVTLEPIMAPWEPSVVYTLNGAEVASGDEVYTSLQGADYSGGSTLEVTGFNLAVSPMSHCGWGPRPLTLDGFKLDGVAPNELVCTDESSSTSARGRWDGATPAMLAYELLTPSPTLTTVPTVAADGKSLTCAAAAPDAPGAAFFAIGSTLTMTMVPFEIMDQVLQCEAGGFLSVDGVAEDFDAARDGYTLSAWVKPAATGGGGGGGGGPVRALLEQPSSAAATEGSTKKFNRRRMMGHSGAVTTYAPTTVLSLGGADGAHLAAVLYDGEKFMYYDDNILDAANTGGAHAKGGEWHLVTVTWTRDGEGLLFVDGHPAERFTTKSSPMGAGAFTVCADADGGGSFTGLVDEIQLFDYVVPGLDASTHLTYSWPTGDDAAAPAAWATFNFKVGMSPVQEERGVATPTGPLQLVAAKAARAAPDAMFVDPPEGPVNAGDEIVVYGANFVISDAFQVMVGDTLFTYAAGDLTVVPGTVVSVVGVRLMAPPATSCGAVAVSASNDGGASYGAVVEYVYTPALSDLNVGLHGYWSFDVHAKGTEEGLITFPDQVGANPLSYHAELATVDRDGFENRAVLFGAGIEGGVPTFESALIPDGPATICWWVLMDPDYLDKLHDSLVVGGGDPEDTYIPLAQSLARTVGGWRMLSFVVSEAGASPTVYVNEEQVDVADPALAVFMAMFDAMHASNALVCGPPTMPTLECVSDSLFVYNRALRPCEVEARFRSVNFAIHAPDGVPGSINDPRPFYTVTAEAWVWPSGSPEYGSVVRVGDMLDLGVAGDTISFGVGKSGCVCPEACSEWHQHTAHRAKALPGRWTHIAAVFDGYKIVFYSDGVMADVFIADYTHSPYDDFALEEYLLRQPWNLEVGPGLSPEPSNPFDQPSYAAFSFVDQPMTIGQGFDGLIYDVRVTPMVIDPPLDLWDYTVCPRKDEPIGSTYFSLGEGVGDVSLAAHAHGTEAVSAVTGLASAWFNYSFDGASHLPSTELVGDAQLGIVAGRMGKFTVVPRTSCGRKRLGGDDPWSVTFTKDAVTRAPQLLNRGDGNLDVVYWAGVDMMSVDTTRNLTETYPDTPPQVDCGVWRATLSFDDEAVTEWDVSIRADTSVAYASHVEEHGDEGPFGVLTRFVVQTMDSHGCNAWEEYDLDSLVAHVSGPYETQAPLTPLGDGRYEIGFVPEAPGTYTLEVTLNGETVKDGKFCFTASAGYSARFTGAGYVTVYEDGATGLSDIDMAFEQATFESWFKLTQYSDAYLLYKGTAEELVNGAQSKGYQLRVSGPDGNRLSASVYTGDGDVREVEGAFVQGAELPLDQWLHVAAVYTGERMHMYYNGNLIASNPPDEQAPWAVKRIKPNYFDHPLLIGYNLQGNVDDVAMWRTALPAVTLRNRLYCPAPLISADALQHLAAYWPFNEAVLAESQTAVGFGWLCGPLRTDCLVATGVTYDMQVDLQTLTTHTVYASGGPEFETLGGIGTPSAANTIVESTAPVAAGSSVSPVIVHAKDVCDYSYMGGAQAFTARVRELPLTYFSADEPDVAANELPKFVEKRTYNEAMNNAEGFCAGTSSSLWEVTLPQGGVAPGSYRAQVYAGPAGNPAFVAVQQRFAVTPAAASTLAVAEGSAEGATVAGVPRLLTASVVDAMGNALSERMEFTAKLSLQNKGYSMEYVVEPADMTWHADSFTYTFHYTAGVEGEYSLEMYGDGLTPLTVPVTVEPAPWLAMPLASPAPDAVTRFEAASAAADDHLYVFGGASEDKTYLSDLWVLQNGAVKDQFAYLKAVEIVAEEALSDGATVEVVVDTAELIAAGRLRPDCADLGFVTDDMALMHHYVDSRPGCDSSTTRMYVKTAALAEGPNTVYMLYGNAAMTADVNPHLAPAEVMAFYDGFEGTEPLLSLTAPCDAATAAATMDGWDAPWVNGELAAAGKQSLYWEWGTSYVMSAPLSSPLTAFTMRALFWDSNSDHAAHFMSPNHGECDLIMEDDESKPVHPDTHTPRPAAVGTFTLATKRYYATAAPWVQTAVTRSGAWHEFEISSTLDGRTVISVDGTVVKEEEGAQTMTKVYLSGGLGTEGVMHPGLAASHARWDELYVMALSPAVATAVPMSADVPYGAHLGRSWAKVEPTGGVEPPARYSHTMLAYESALVVFGGERSAFSFGDVWMFDIPTGSWEFVTPTSSASPPPRFDHTATLVGDTMVVYGGRSGKEILGDMWAFDIPSRRWTHVASPSLVGARFGHAAAVRAGSDELYLFGGYAPATGFTTDFFKCSVTTGDCEDVKTTCQGKGGAGPFPPQLAPRYAHTAVADERFYYIYGGSNLQSTDGFDTLFRVNVDPTSADGAAGCNWEQVPLSGAAPSRYEHSTAVAHGRLLIHGGHDAGKPQGSVYVVALA